MTFVPEYRVWEFLKLMINILRQFVEIVGEQMFFWQKELPGIVGERFCRITGVS